MRTELMNISSIKVRVTFVLPTMGGGGAERVTLALMRGFVDRGYEVELVLTEKGGNLLHLVPKEVYVELFECPRIRNSVLRLREYIKRRQPNVMIVSLWPLTAASVIARMGLEHKPRLVLSDHNHLTNQYSANRKGLFLLRSSLRYLYPKADALVGVSDGVARNVSEIAGLDCGKVATVFNPIPVPKNRGWPREVTDALWHDHRGPRIIISGRFKSQKNHSLLLQAFAKMRLETDAVLTMLGEGELEDDLRAEISVLNLTDHVLMPGFVDDPSPYYASANVLALSSNYEGFGNVLVEAMHFGLTIVSTDCMSGPSEVLEHGRYGTLVPTGNVDALAAALLDAIDNPINPVEMQKRALDFSSENAIDAYEKLAFP